MPLCQGLNEYCQKYFYPECILIDSRVLNLAVHASVFPQWLLEAIFASTFRREIGRQFLRSQRSWSFFSISVITACLCDGFISPLIKDSLKHSTKSSPTESQFDKILLAIHHSQEPYLMQKNSIPLSILLRWWLLRQAVYILPKALVLVVLRN